MVCSILHCTLLEDIFVVLEESPVCTVERSAVHEQSCETAGLHQ